MGSVIFVRAQLYEEDDEELELNELELLELELDELELTELELELLLLLDDPSVPP